MKAWLPWVLLAVSVAFNGLFAVGMLMARARHRRLATPEGRAELLADELGMDEEQRAAHRELAKEFRVRREELRGRHRAEFQKAWAELVKDEPDERVLEEFIRTSGSSEKRKLFVEHTRGLMKILQPQQRERAAEIIKGHHRKRRR